MTHPDISIRLFIIRFLSDHDFPRFYEEPASEMLSTDKLSLNYRLIFFDSPHPDMKHILNPKLTDSLYSLNTVSL